MTLNLPRASQKPCELGCARQGSLRLVFEAIGRGRHAVKTFEGSTEGKLGFIPDVASYIGQRRTRRKQFGRFQHA